MVFNRWLFLFTLIFLAGYYTPLTLPSQIWIAAVPLYILTLVLGLRRWGIPILCLLALCAGCHLGEALDRRPEQCEQGSGVWSFQVRTTTTRGVLLTMADGRDAWASSREMAASVSRGDSVIVLGSMDDGFLNTNVFRHYPSGRMHDRLRRSLSTGIRENIPSRQAGSLAAALLAGDRGGVPETVRDLFRDTGTSHLLALSGLHAGIIAAAVLGFLRIVFGKSLKTVLACVVVTGIFALVSGGRASTMRAWIMISLVLILWQARGRTPDLLFVWSLAALVLITFSSGRILEDTGAQMSFGAVLSLLLLGRRIRGAGGWFLSAVYAGVVITVALAPLVSYVYGGFNPASPLATALSLPLMLGVMSGGLLSIVPLVGASASALTEWTAFAWLEVLKFLETEPIVFQGWMYLIWVPGMLVLWILSRGRGIFRRFL